MRAREDAVLTPANARLLQHVAAALEPAGVTGPLRVTGSAPGGCIHESIRVQTADGSRLFLKTNSAARADLFVQEAAGLEHLRVAGGPRIPEVLGTGVGAARAWLALEHIELQSRGDPAAFGHALARLHGCSAGAFGAAQDNYIGTTAQPNGWYGDWAEFWRERRLGHQLELAERDNHRHLAERGRWLAEHLDPLLTEHRPQPSTLHGDLWAGNAAYDESGCGVLFDPAFYYGDRETDIAMTELFGGFPSEFYAAYREAWPLDHGYTLRREVYNLYHVLNHAHLFGGAYVQSAERMIERLLAELGVGSGK